MAAEKTSWIIVFLLSVSFALGEEFRESHFTKEIKLRSGRRPIKLNDRLKIHDGISLISPEVGGEECKSSPLNIYLWPKSISTFGNGKLLLSGEYLHDYAIIDYENCSSYTTTLLSYGKDLHPDGNTRVAYTSVVMYNDTFEVFGLYQEYCMPCRFNDKGQLLTVEYSLDHETDVHWDRDHPVYSMQSVKDAFGVENGYLYILKKGDGTTALRILDPKFKIVKQRLFAVNIEAHSLTGQNLTVCYKCVCKDDICQYICCHLLDPDLNSIAEVELHRFKTDTQQRFDLYMNVQNLAGGGAMVAMNFEHSTPVYQHVFIQRIHPNGRVDPSIKIGNFKSVILPMYGFTFNNGEYCLVTSNTGDPEYNGGALIKCLKPSPADYDKL